MEKVILAIRRVFCDVDKPLRVDRTTPEEEDVVVDHHAALFILVGLFLGSELVEFIDKFFRLLDIVLLLL
jgi:hypothetical protein